MHTQFQSENLKGKEFPNVHGYRWEDINMDLTGKGCEGIDCIGLGLAQVPMVGFCEHGQISSSTEKGKSDQLSNYQCMKKNPAPQSYILLVSSSEHDNEPSGSIKEGDLLE
jgi:hypothetical protein